MRGWLSMWYRFVVFHYEGIQTTMCLGYIEDFHLNGGFNNWDFMLILM